MTEPGACEVLRTETRSVITDRFRARISMASMGFANGLHTSTMRRISLVSKRNALLRLPNDNDTFECEGENFRRCFVRCTPDAAKFIRKSPRRIYGRLGLNHWIILFLLKIMALKKMMRYCFLWKRRRRRKKKKLHSTRSRIRKAPRKCSPRTFEKDSLFQDKFVEPHIMEMRESVNTKGESTIVERMKDSFFDMEPQKISNGPKAR